MRSVDIDLRENFALVVTKKLPPQPAQDLETGATSFTQNAE